MNIAVLVDSFKGSLSSLEAGNIIKDSILEINDKENIKVMPVADGGEGMVESLADLKGASETELVVKDPLLRNIKAKYIILDNKNIHPEKVAIIEMSAAAGITLISDSLSPMEASTYGVGDIIIDALDRGVKSFIVGIGGSATNDGGVGMLTRLGVDFLNDKGKKIHPSALGIKELDKIDISNMDSRLNDCKFAVACDVTNPLTGPNGSAHVFGPQKGASPKQVEEINDLHCKLYEKTREIINDADSEYPGSGAAGGLGYAFKNYLDAELSSGIKIILDLLKAEDIIRETDIVITGEGRLDKQSAYGKTPIGVAKLAKKYGKTVIAFSGVASNEAEVVNEEGIDAFFPIIGEVIELKEAMDKEVARENLRRCVKQVFRLIYKIK
ncbi:glycerate kinase [Anaerococcus porci]|uniref:glycerate kinase n=1 Tax=Anaerococcus porci TaxID=2652269 RepID=UPI002A74F9DE|nr:glycerate kinase [Anaerococcus porci]MDY3006683.1 glycerate kinase [Anaerococcus porci]